MEFGVNSELRTYAGGLGVLAGDIFKSATDLGIPFFGVGLLYTQGYFRQRITGDGWQEEVYADIDPNEFLTPLDLRVHVGVEHKTLQLMPWMLEYKGETGFTNPLFFLNSNGNKEDWLEKMTKSLYMEAKDDNRFWRIGQEIALGVGAIRLAYALHEQYGFGLPEVWHLNEGHPAFGSIERAKQELAKNDGRTLDQILKEVKATTIFTTHTPVPAGHDAFYYPKVFDMMPGYFDGIDIKKMAGQDRLNMTSLAMNLARYSYAVAKRHFEVTRAHLHLPINGYITNGVHPRTWTSPPFVELFNQYLPGWSMHPEIFAEARQRIPSQALVEAKRKAKLELIAYVKEKTGRTLDPDKPIVGFARRFATYKRANLLGDFERMHEVSQGDIQLVVAGKAHPNDDDGKKIIQGIIRSSAKHENEETTVFIPDYDMKTGAKMTSGADVWLNMPRRPQEASGTSGMKTLFNAGMNASILDGWFCETEKDEFGERRGGYPIGPEPTFEDWNPPSIEEVDRRDADAMYSVLGQIRSDYRAHPGKIVSKMYGALENAAVFNTHRVVMQQLELYNSK